MIYCHVILHLLLLCSFCRIRGKSQVMELDESFRAIRFKGKWLVLFYSPWYASLNELFLNWEELANIFSITGLRVAKFDTNANRKVSGIIGIRATPTILFYNYGIEYEFTGKISKVSILHFTEAINAELLKEIVDYSNFSSLVTNNPVLFLCVYNGTLDTRFHEIYTKGAIGLKHRNKFYFTTNTTAFNNSYMNPNIIVYKISQPYYYEGEHSLIYLSDWIYNEQFELFPYVHSSEMPYIVSNCRDKLIGIFVYIENTSFLTQLWNKTIYKLTKERKFHDHLLVITTHACTTIEKIIGVCPTLPKFIVWNSSNLVYFDFDVYLNDHDVDKLEISLSLVEEFVIKILQKDIISISGYSYFFAVNAILTDIFVAQMSLIYSYPFISLIFMLLLILFSFISCFNFMKSIYIII